MQPKEQMAVDMYFSTIKKILAPHNEHVRVKFEEIHVSCGLEFKLPLGQRDNCSFRIEIQMYSELTIVCVCIWTLALKTAVKLN